MAEAYGQVPPLISCENLGKLLIALCLRFSICEMRTVQYKIQAQRVLQNLNNYGHVQHVGSVLKT